PRCACPNLTRAATSSSDFPAWQKAGPMDQPADTPGPGPEPGSTPGKPARPPRSAPWMRSVKLGVVALFVVSAGVGAWFWWEHEIAYPSTDDAYVQSNLILIAPQVDGRVEQVN